MSKRSERKRREEEERRRQEMMRRQMMLMQQQQRLMMQRQQQQMGPGGMTYGPMNGGANPCAMPSRFIQLTPIIQPIAMVPYSTQNQPLLMYNNNNANDPGGFGTYADSFGGYDSGFDSASLGRAFQNFSGGDDDYF